MACECINITFKPRGGSIQTETLNSSGTYAGYDYFTFTSGTDTYYIYYDATSGKWGLDIILGYDPPRLGLLALKGDCPEGEFTLTTPKIDTLSVSGCGCVILQDRTFKKYDSIKLPKIFEEEDRGYFRCCCPFIVMADGSTDSWKNDVTSAWLKLSNEFDTYDAQLYKNGVLSTYQPTAVAFINEPNTYYWTIQWKDVLASDGIGCYELKITYDISGISQVFTWGVYNLKQYTVQNALKTARLRVVFDSFQEIENIDFTGSQVEDSIRFYGYIGSRQPNMETDNLIYKNREMKKVIRENLNTYEIHVDPTCNEHIDKLTDLYLLSENELYISDYNAHNPSYKYQDLPCIVEESPEIVYFDFSREVGLKATVADKFKDKRSYFK